MALNLLRMTVGRGKETGIDTQSDCEGMYHAETMTWTSRERAACDEAVLPGENCRTFRGMFLRLLRIESMMKRGLYLLCDVV